MKKIVFFIALILQSFLCFSASMPKWISNLESEFPKKKYIAYLGVGDSIENAKANALAQIAGFFKSEVVVSTSASSSLMSDGEKVTENQELNQNVNVASDITLTAVEYNQPYYEKKEKTYYVVAYINRELGLQYIESEIFQLRTKYDAFLELAKQTEYPILQYKYLTRTKSTSEKLISAFYMEVLFDSSKKKKYRDFISEVTKSVELEILDSFRIPIYVVSQGDYQNLITSKVFEVFKRFGCMPYNELKDDIKTILKIEIKCNEKIESGICSIYPEISIKFSNIKETKIFYSYQNRWGKTSNFSLIQAQKKAFPKITDELKTILITDYQENFLSK